MTQPQKVHRVISTTRYYSGQPEGRNKMRRFFLIIRSYHLTIVSQLGLRLCTHFPPLTWGFYLSSACAGFTYLRVHVCISLLCQENSVSLKSSTILSPYTLSPPLPHPHPDALSLKGRGMIKPSHSGLHTPESLTLHIADLWVSANSHLLQEAVSQLKVGQCFALCLEQSGIRIHFIAIFV